MDKGPLNRVLLLLLQLSPNVQNEERMNYCVVPQTIIIYCMQNIWNNAHTTTAKSLLITNAIFTIGTVERY